MRYITERELREQFAGGAPEHYEPPADARLTPAARQYLIDLRLYRPPASPARAVLGVPAPSFQPGGPKKPEHMTNLNSRELVCKNHPRIVLRGKLDTLESEILVLQVSASSEWFRPLQDAIDLVRRVLAADVKDSELGDWKLDGMTSEEVHRCSHHPEEFGFPGHILPAAEHGLLAAQLNRLRAISREAELAAINAWWSSERLAHEDCVLALNRLSSYFYVLQLRAARR